MKVLNYLLKLSILNIVFHCLFMISNKVKIKYKLKKNNLNTKNKLHSNYNNNSIDNYYENLYHGFIEYTNTNNGYNNYNNFNTNNIDFNSEYVNLSNENNKYEFNNYIDTDLISNNFNNNVDNPIKNKSNNHKKNCKDQINFLLKKELKLNTDSNSNIIEKFENQDNIKTKDANLNNSSHSKNRKKIDLNNKKLNIINYDPKINNITEKNKLKKDNTNNLKDNNYTLNNQEINKNNVEDSSIINSNEDVNKKIRKTESTSSTDISQNYNPLNRNNVNNNMNNNNDNNSVSKSNPLNLNEINYFNITSFNKPNTIQPDNLSNSNLNTKTVEEFIKSIITNRFSETDYNNFVYNQKGRYDLTLKESELKQLFVFMLKYQDKAINDQTLHEFISIFVVDYMNCDIDKSSTLTFIEFKNCLINNSYFKQFIPVVQEFMSHEELKDNTYNNIKNKNSYNNYNNKYSQNNLNINSKNQNYNNNNKLNNNFSNSSIQDENFYYTLFGLIEDKGVGFINFVQYMNLRLFTFAWRTCSTSSPYMYENAFKCAIDITSAGERAIPKNKALYLYNYAVDLVNTPNIKYIDFPTFVSLAISVRLFSKINLKSNDDLTRSEFNTALETDMLPPRYNKEIIKFFFFLEQKEVQSLYSVGIDLCSFVFYDFILQMFAAYSINNNNFYLSRTEFINLISRNYLFPKKIFNEISLIPQYEINDKSYSMEMINTLKIDEKNHLLRTFIELKSNSSIKSNSKASYKSKIKNNIKYNPNPDLNVSEEHNSISTKSVYDVPFNLNKTLNRIFDALNSNLSNNINFYDFAIFMQIGYVFQKLDEFSKGRLLVESVKEGFKNWSDYPIINFRIKQAADRLVELNDDLPMDYLTIIQLCKMQDFAIMIVKNKNDIYINELNLKKILKQFNMQYIPDIVLNRCLRGTDKYNVPRYDWECGIMQGIRLNLKYFEVNDYYHISKKMGINLKTTSFYNVDQYNS